MSEVLAHFFLFLCCYYYLFRCIRPWNLLEKSVKQNKKIVAITHPKIMVRIWFQMFFVNRLLFIMLEIFMPYITMPTSFEVIEATNVFYDKANKEIKHLYIFSVKLPLLSQNDSPPVVSASQSNCILVMIIMIHSV